MCWASGASDLPCTFLCTVKTRPWTRLWRPWPSRNWYCRKHQPNQLWHGSKEAHQVPCLWTFQGTIPQTITNIKVCWGFVTSIADKSRQITRSWCLEREVRLGVQGNYSEVEGCPSRWTWLWKVKPNPQMGPWISSFTPGREAELQPYLRDRREFKAVHLVTPAYQVWRHLAYRWCCQTAPRSVHTKGREASWRVLSCAAAPVQSSKSRRYLQPLGQKCRCLCTVLEIMI